MPDIASRASVDPCVALSIKRSSAKLPSIYKKHAINPASSRFGPKDLEVRENLAEIFGVG
jgi:hypothetical protein